MIPVGLPAPLVELDRAAVMGVLNVTPDSFSDGGHFLEPARAVAHGLRMRADGADIIDVGGESTRPGAQRVPVEEELARVLPVVAGLVAGDALVSIDTMRADVARAAVEAGACVVNDVSGGRADPRMHETVAELGVPYVIMHWRGHSAGMTELARYDDVVADVVAELTVQSDAAVAAGIDPGAIVLDPGLGFAKESDHNWELLRHLDTILGLGFPVLVGASRKRFLGALLADEDGEPRAMEERDAATDAVTAIAAVQGVWAVRVHDVRRSRDAVRVAAAWRRGRQHE